MGKLSGGDIVVRALEDEGVPFTFGIPGTHNIELYDSLGRSEKVRPVLVTDEQSASFMADGVSRSSGALGCVNLVPGAGLTHALSGVAEAWLDGIPMLVLVCGIRSDTGRAYQLHDVDQLALAAPVTKAQMRPAEGAQIYATIREACAIARRAPAGPVIVEIPVDHYLFKHVPGFDSWRGEESEPAMPDPVSLERAVSLLRQAKRPLLYLGLGAAGAGESLVALAERLEAPVATTFQGKGCFPEDHPLWLWCGFGPAAPPFVQKLVETCDLTLAIGCRFAEVGTGSYGVPPPGTLIHVDVDPEVIGRNYPAEVALTAEAELVVPALIDAVDSRDDDADLRGALRRGHQTALDRWSSSGGNERVSPAVLLKTLQEVYGSETIYTTDSGNGTFLAMECLRLPMSRSFLAPVDYSCMGYSVPAALGAALACPARPVVALAGDGAFLMTGLELLTACQLELPVTVLVLRDRELAQIAQFQQRALARKTATQLPDYDLSALTKAVGADYLQLSSDGAVRDVLSRARKLTSERRPVVVEVEIDYAQETYFTAGVVRTNFGRLPWKDRLRFILRVIKRRMFG